MEMPDDFCFCNRAHEINNRPSPKMDMDDGQTLAPEEAQELPGAQGIANTLLPVEGFCRDSSLFKQIDKGTIAGQEQGVNAVPPWIEALRERAHNRGHACAFGLSGAKDVEYMLSHCSSNALFSIWV